MKEFKDSPCSTFNLMTFQVSTNYYFLTAEYFVQEIAKLLKCYDSNHKNALVEYIIQDLNALSDFDIHKTCETYRVR